MDKTQSLRLFMEQYQLSTSDVAQILNVSKSAVYKWRAYSFPQTEIPDYRFAELRREVSL